jgi:hypothetical protein
MTECGNPPLFLPRDFAFDEDFRDLNECRDLAEKILLKCIFGPANVLCGIARPHNIESTGPTVLILVGTPIDSGPRCRCLRVRLLALCFSAL